MRTHLKAILVLGIASVGSAHAENWAKIYTCESGAAYVDVNTDERRDLQLVLKGDDLLGKMYSAGMIGLNYGQHEFILRGQHAELKQVSPTATQPTSLGGVFSPQDLKKIYWDSGANGASAIEVEVRGGNELVFKQLHYTQGLNCGEDPSGECPYGVFHKTYYFIAEYVLRGCRYE